ATLTAVPYGAVSAYLPVAAGTYTVSMRPVGAAASTPAVLTGAVRVSAGKAYSVLATGVQKADDLTLVADDLTAPPPGKARVRMGQASTKATALDVAAVGGPVLVQDARYARG